jgi:hypothetical protein
MSHTLRSVQVPVHALAVTAGLVLGDGTQRAAAIVLALVLLARVLLHRRTLAAGRTPSQPGRREVLPAARLRRHAA